MIFKPEANQGPLVGIFLTGPLGVVIGALIGAIVGWRKGLTVDRTKIQYPPR